MRARRLFTHFGKRPQQPRTLCGMENLAPFFVKSFTPFDKNSIRKTFGLDDIERERARRKQEDEKRKVTQQTGQRVAKVRGAQVGPSLFQK